MNLYKKRSMVIFCKNSFLKIVSYEVMEENMVPTDTTLMVM